MLSEAITFTRLYVGETLLVEREEGNVHDSYAVSIKKDDSVVGHVPREISSYGPWRNYWM